MRTGVVGLVLLIVQLNAWAQVDTSYVFKSGLPYGSLDIRIAKSSTRYYYLQENRTVSFRESAPGVKTNTYRDMTAWDSSPYKEGNMREKNGTADAWVMNYRLLQPINYNPNYAAGYPLIVFLHGAGERGNCWKSTCYHGGTSWNPAANDPPAPKDATSKLMNNDHNLLHGGSTHLQMVKAANGKLPNDPTLSSRSFPGFVLFPQNLNGWNAGSVQDAIKLVRLVAKKYNIDENRIYIEGLSNGGYAVYETIKRAPWLFASAVTMSAVSDASITYHNLQSTTAHIPLWTFQGGQDTDPTPARTESYVRKFRAAGAVVRYNKYDNLGHGTWNTAMNEPDFFKWILSQNKSNIHLFAGSAAICRTNGEGVRMELGPGFRAYQWERNGVIISGATTNKYTATTAGTYRARFSRKANPGASDWNQWSVAITVTEVNPPQAQLDQVGTVVLKDPNAFNDAKLKAVGTFGHYYWYRNGSLISSIPDTVNEPIIKSTNGNGTYTLVTAQFDNCPSPPSKPKYIFFNDTAPVNITTPSNVKATIPTSGTIRLTWTDGATNEGGYEIWRRRQTGSTTYSAWEMRILTAANIATFDDKPVAPSTSYYYRIRAVSSTGRSNYSADLKVTTGSDGSAPSTPANLQASAVAVRSVKLTWTASTDNSGIKQYRIYYGSTVVSTNSTSTTHTLTNLNLNTNYTFTVRAEDLGGNLSSASNSASASTYVSGLFYEHSTGAWVDLDNINWAAPAEFTGKETTFSISRRTQEDFFNFEFDGYIYINTAGTYYFQTSSSDGSRIELDGTMVVNNDGVHANRTITSAAMTLSAGAHRINVKYFEFDESHVLTVRYRGPDTGNNMVTIPATALKSGNPPSSAATAQETTAPEAGRQITATIYPNPTTESDINVQMESEAGDPVEIKVIDFTGRQVFQGVFDADEVMQGVRILPTQTMRDGIYLLIMNQNGKVTKERISIKNE